MQYNHKTYFKMYIELNKNNNSGSQQYNYTYMYTYAKSNNNTQFIGYIAVYTIKSRV